MLYSLFLGLVDSYTFLNVFKYLTVRTGLAMFTSMMVVFFIGNPIGKISSDAGFNWVSYRNRTRKCSRKLIFLNFEKS